MRFGTLLVAIPFRLLHMVFVLEDCEFESCRLDGALAFALVNLEEGWMAEMIQEMDLSEALVNLMDGNLVISHQGGPLTTPYLSKRLESWIFGWVQYSQASLGHSPTGGLCQS